MRHEVFVYGSLKNGFWNNRLLVDGGAVFVGQACTAEFGLLVDGPFPYFVTLSQRPLHALAGNVYGEVWSVDDDTLKRLDQLEGVPHHYTRETIRVQFAPGQSRPVFVYRVANPERFKERDFIKPNVNDVLTWPTAKTRAHGYA